MDTEPESTIQPLPPEVVPVSLWKKAILMLVCALFILGAGYAFIVLHVSKTSSVPSITLETSPMLPTAAQETAVLPLATTTIATSATLPQTAVVSQNTQKASEPFVPGETTFVSKDVQFSVKKVPTDYVFDFYQTERTLLLGVQTYSATLDPKTLSLCMTLTDENDRAFTETDCWPLEKFGTWSYASDGDLNLAPGQSDYEPFTTAGVYNIRIRFELVEGLIKDYGDAQTRSRYRLLAAGNTGVFKLKLGN